MSSRLPSTLPMVAAVVWLLIQLATDVSAIAVPGLNSEITSGAPGALNASASRKRAENPNLTVGFPELGPPSEYIGLDWLIPPAGSPYWVFDLEDGESASIVVETPADGSDGPSTDQIDAAVRYYGRTHNGVPEHPGALITNGVTNLEQPLHPPGLNLEIRVRFFEGTPLAISYVTLARYIAMAVWQRRFNAFLRGNSVILTPVFTMTISALDQPQPTPPVQPPYYPMASPASPSNYFSGSGGGSCPSRDRRDVIPPPKKRCVRKCKGCKHSPHNDTADPADSSENAPKPYVRVPRRNESVWIGPSTGWQAVQVSHAARALGYNVSEEHDYLSFYPNDNTAHWGGQIAHCASKDDIHKTVAGLIFGCKSPSPEEQRIAEAVLLGQPYPEENATSAASTGQTSNAPRGLCQGTKSTSIWNGITQSQVDDALYELSMNPLQRLPDDWNSLKIRDVHIAWANNANCGTFFGLGPCRKPRFNGNRPPSFEEVLPYFQAFRDETWWSLPPWRFSCMYKDAYFGKVVQAVCISNRAKRCSNPE